MSGKLDESDKALGSFYLFFICQAGSSQSWRPNVGVGGRVLATALPANSPRSVGTASRVSKTTKSSIQTTKGKRP